MKRLRWRIFISFNLLFTFLVMGISGIILYFKPEGSVARWLGWEIWGLSKSGWEAVHTVFSLLFLIFSVLHIIKINLISLKRYFLNSKPGGTLREMRLALLISVVFFTGTVLYLPPFHFIYQAGDYLSNSWNHQIEIKHEGLDARQTIREAAVVMGLDEHRLVSVLEDKHGYKVSLSGSLRENAENNGVAPYVLYDAIRSVENAGQIHQTNGVLKHITLEEIAVVLDVQPSKLTDITAAHFDLDTLTRKTTLEKIAGKSGCYPEDVKNAIIRQVNHLFSLPDSE
ncbi:MAG: DUF4405 domain-containing protein [Bacteroidales bacterium]